MDLSLVAWSSSDGLGVIAGLLGGLASSAHCAAMCGPLACAVTAPALVRLGRERPADLARERRRASLAYHGGRTVAYGLIGALLGLAGEGVRRGLHSVAPILPWIMAAALVVSALRLGQHLSLPAPRVFKRWLGGWARWSANFSPVVRAGAMGVATPLLPCATLYPLSIAAAATGSSAGGAGLMAAFAIGATPALALVQAHAPLLGRHPRAAAVIQRGLPLLAAALLIFRALSAGAGSAPPTCH